MIFAAPVRRLILARNDLVREEFLEHGGIEAVSCEGKVPRRAEIMTVTANHGDTGIPVIDLEEVPALVRAVKGIRLGLGHEGVSADQAKPPDRMAGTGRHIERVQGGEADRVEGPSPESDIGQLYPGIPLECLLMRSRLEAVEH